MCAKTGKTKTVDVTKMPHNAVKDLLSGALSFDKAYAMYPGPDYTTHIEDNAEKMDGDTR